MTIERRKVLGWIAGACVAPAIAGVARAQTVPSASSFSFAKAGGGALPLAEYRGRPVLIVNTATQCGFAGQFATLEQLWQRYRDRGLMLIAVPSNDFGGQEPLEGAAIAEAARQSHGATYPFAEKTAVRGGDAHPFYRWAAAQRPAEAPRWNFHKYLIGRSGELVGGYAAQIDPISPRLVRAIGQELQAG
ncbi:glutathione peroxidase [Bosea sp. Root381]|uniref:glutathione peroxidase n=1 Tax=Bosea sp. Root381 TaxID=1736524 RepID=UPI0006F2F62C|nr:glutathione peroxidase [Bosea sp. Root381]KRE00451.1 glutathione peroxidase [Bosea sp. Root381]